jgi:hypothetical protein
MPDAAIDLNTARRPLPRPQHGGNGHVRIERVSVLFGDGPDDPTGDAARTSTDGARPRAGEKRQPCGGRSGAGRAVHGRGLHAPYLS